MSLTMVVALLLVVGGTVYIHDRVYPRTWIGSARISRLKKDEAVHWLESKTKQVQAFTFTQEGREPKTAQPSELGVSYDTRQTIEHVFAEQRTSKLGWLQLWHVRRTGAMLSIDSRKLETFLRAAFPTATVPAINAGLVYDANSKSFSITPEKEGFDLQLARIATSLQEVAEHVQTGTIPVTTGALLPDIKASQLPNLKTLADTLLGKKIRIQGINGIREIASDEIAGWVSTGLDEHKQPVLRIDTSKLRDSIVNIASMSGTAPVPRKIVKDVATGKETVTQAGRVGQTVSNIDTTVTAIDTALTEHQDYSGTFTYVDVPFQTTTTTIDSRIQYTYTYSVETRGTFTVDLNEFITQAAETYADARGWRGAGRAFTRVASGGDFTLVLSQASYVPLFSSACSSTYSCRVGRYVIINQDRWLSATDAWNASGGSLRDYRHMVINHETGHWLGFEHRTCPASGQPAPVMMQQSISLGGCVFNPWPTAAELAAL